MRIIDTERLILQPLTVADAEDAFEWQSDPEVNRYMIYPLCAGPLRPIFPLRRQRDL